MSKEADVYVCKVAKTVDEAKQLLEKGFDYVRHRGHATFPEAEGK